jgi:hypothetical protein
MIDRALMLFYSTADPSDRRSCAEDSNRFDWTAPELLDLQTLFLRAARVVDDRRLDVPMPLRGQIASKMEKSGVLTLQTAKIKGFIPVGRSDQASLYDEALPPGLILVE